MLRVDSEGFLENVTIEKLTPRSTFTLYGKGRSLFGKL
jgi:hypothetical protein